MVRSLCVNPITLRMSRRLHPVTRPVTETNAYVITPPWSTITAYDLNTGKIKWQTPYGDLPQAGPSDKLRGNAYPKSGFVITAGGLVLFAGNDSKLYGLEQRHRQGDLQQRSAQRIAGRARSV